MKEYIYAFILILNVCARNRRKSPIVWGVIITKQKRTNERTITTNLTPTFFLFVD